MRRRELLVALLLSPGVARAEYRESGLVDAGASRRAVLAGAARERVEVTVRAAGFTPRVVVTGRDGAALASAEGSLRLDLPRAGEYDITVESTGGAGTYQLALASDVAARRARGPAARWIGAGGGFGERGGALVGGAELAVGPLLVSARGELAFGRGFEATALAGFGPGFASEAQDPVVERDAVCVDETCWERASRVRFRPPRPTARRPFALLGGVRVGRGGFSERLRVSGVIAGRWYHGRADRASFSRDIVELGVAQLVSGRDRPFLRHASFIPGWYLLAQRQLGVVVGAELGITGLTHRDESARLDPELYARVHVSFPVDL